MSRTATGHDRTSAIRRFTPEYRVNPRVLILMTALLSAIGGRALAQGSAGETAAQKLVGQTLFLRGFNGDATIHGRWDGKTIVQEEPRFREVSMMNVKGVEVKPGSVEIHGRRLLPSLDKDGKPTLNDPYEDVLITVSFDLASSQTALMALRTALFYAGGRETFEDVPRAYRASLVGSVVPASMADSRAHACDCKDCPDQSGPEAIGFKRPGFIRGEAQYPEDVLEKKKDTRFTVGMTVDKNGNVLEPWALGGMSGKSVADTLDSLRKYTFKAATCHDVPVPTRLVLDLSFGLPPTL
jgi:hypothetical protein